MRTNQWATTGGDGLLSAREREFLRASLLAEANEHALAARRTRRLRRLLAVLTALVVVATAATGNAVDAREAATEQRNCVGMPVAERTGPKSGRSRLGEFRGAAWG